MRAEEAQRQLEETTEEMTVQVDEKPKPGFCPKCKKHIGRGVYFHMRKCNV